MTDINTDNKWLGPVKGYCLFHVFDNPIFWLGVALIIVFGSEAVAASLYNLTYATLPVVAQLISSAFDWGHSHGVAWWGLLLMGLSIVGSFVRYRVTRFAIEKGVLVVTRGKFSLNPLAFFQRNDYTVALNLIYDVDVRKTIFQYLFGGGDVYVRTASNDIFHLEFVQDPHDLREYLIEHSGIKNKPVIGIY